MNRFLLYPKQDYHEHNLGHLKWVKTTKFLILGNGTSMSATNQHSSKWYPRLNIALVKWSSSPCLTIWLSYLSPRVSRTACWNQIEHESLYQSNEVKPGQQQLSQSRCHCPPSEMFFLFPQKWCCFLANDSDKGSHYVFIIFYGKPSRML